VNTTFAQVGFPVGFFAIIVGHATFCIVIVYDCETLLTSRAA